MKTNLVITVLCIISTGCNENVKKAPDKSAINVQLIKTYNDMALENAIISQHTLYPYHFVKNGADLNELGKRDLAVLTKHFITEPGYLNIRKSDTSEDLYASRVELVNQILQKAGLNMDKISIGDEMPGGSGIASETILVILEKENENKPSSESTKK
jgi:hypothetical protein